MHVEASLSPALTLKSACIGKNALFHYFKKNVRVKGLTSCTSMYVRIMLTLGWIAP